MKKLLNILLIWLLAVSLTSCFWKTTTDDDIEDAKNELLNGSWGTNTNWTDDVPKYEDDYNSDSDDNNTTTPTNTWSTVDENSSSNNVDDVVTDKVEITYMWGENFLEINDLTKQDIDWRKVEISWKVLWDVDKIIVNFSNSTSSFPDDRYQLSQFKKWDTSFLYRAFSQYQTIDYWTNEYIIEAYSWDTVSRVEIVITVPEKKNSWITDTPATTTQKDDEKDDTNNSSSTLNSTSVTNLNLDSMPTSTVYWKPKTLSSGKVGYSDVDWLEIELVESGLDLDNSDDVNSFLIDTVSGWFYWNSHSSSSKLTSVYVIRLNGDKYTYEKHYYTPTWIHGVLFLESGTWVTKDNISDANIELKDKNNEFDTTEADLLFRDLSV